MLEFDSDNDAKEQERFVVSLFLEENELEKEASSGTEFWVPIVIVWRLFLFRIGPFSLELFGFFFFF